LAGLQIEVPLQPEQLRATSALGGSGTCGDLFSAQNVLFEIARNGLGIGRVRDPVLSSLLERKELDERNGEPANDDRGDHTDDKQFDERETMLITRPGTAGVRAQRGSDERSNWLMPHGSFTGPHAPHAADPRATLMTLLKRLANIQLPPTNPDGPLICRMLPFDSPSWNMVAIPRHRSSDPTNSLRHATSPSRVSVRSNVPPSWHKLATNT
jgi:hypothetical protein